MWKENSLSFFFLLEISLDGLYTILIFLMHAIMCHDQLRKWYLPLLHAAERLRYVELGTSLLLNFLELDVRGELSQGELTLLPINLEDGLRSVSM